MRVLFGPEHDGLHIDPAMPNGYEWWYFDALSDDGKYALIVIFFLGTPMSPYYKAVVDGKNPLPKDWCGVFVTLHERIPSGYAILSPGGRKRFPLHWNEVAYAYNIYRGGTFAKESASVSIGGSQIQCDDMGNWQVSLDERGLYLGKVTGNLTFASVGNALSQMPVSNDTAGAAHTWVCVAPHCRVTGTITVSSGDTITFSGDGYHDHNFGTLPWDAKEIWSWGRFHTAKKGQEPAWTAVFYQHKQSPTNYLLIVDDTGAVLTQTDTAESKISLPQKSGYGLPFFLQTMLWEAASNATLDYILPNETGLLNGPFYKRSVGQAKIRVGGRVEEAKGISEVFQPSRLCHPIWSRLMWTRIRRRS